MGIERASTSIDAHGSWKSLLCGKSHQGERLTLSSFVGFSLSTYMYLLLEGVTLHNKVLSLEGRCETSRDRTYQNNFMDIRGRVWPACTASHLYFRPFHSLYPRLWQFPSRSLAAGNPYHPHTTRMLYFISHSHRCIMTLFMTLSILYYDYGVWTSFRYYYYYYCSYCCYCE